VAFDLRHGTMIKEHNDAEENISEEQWRCGEGFGKMRMQPHLVTMPQTGLKPILRRKEGQANARKMMNR